jgi:hypothetical protein
MPKQRGVRAGDIFDPNNPPGMRHLLGKMLDFIKPVMGNAAEQGWDYAADRAGSRNYREVNTG